MNSPFRFTSSLPLPLCSLPKVSMFQYIQGRPPAPNLSLSLSVPSPKSPYMQGRPPAPRQTTTCEYNPCLASTMSCSRNLGIVTLPASPPHYPSRANMHFNLSYDENNNNMFPVRGLGLYLDPLVDHFCPVPPIFALLLALDLFLRVPLPTWSPPFSLAQQSFSPALPEAARGTSTATLLA
jgi:hypothetical protein